MPEKHVYDVTCAFGRAIKGASLRATEIPEASDAHWNRDVLRVQVQNILGGQVAGVCTVGVKCAISNVRNEKYGNVARAQALTRRDQYHVTAGGAVQDTVFVCVQVPLPEEDFLTMTGFKFVNNPAVEVTVTSGAGLPPSTKNTPFYIETNITEYVNITLGDAQHTALIIYGLPDGLRLKQGAIVGAPTVHGEFPVYGRYADGTEFTGTIYVYPVHRKK